MSAVTCPFCGCAYVRPHAKDRIDCVKALRRDLGRLAREYEQERAQLKRIVEALKAAPVARAGEGDNDPQPGMIMISEKAVKKLLEFR
jgi:hypothetical protein